MIETLLPGVQFRASPNHGKRHGCDVEVVVLHYDMASDGPRCAGWMCTPQAKRSPHLYVFRNGLPWQLVPLDRAAWHAGASEWWYQGEMTRNVNQFSIGIELANLGMLYRSKKGRFYYEHSGTMYPYRGNLEPVSATLVYDNGAEVSGWWEPYSDAQIDGLKPLLGILYDNGYPTALTGHESIGMPFGRKMDPGPAFPWGEFSGYRGRVTAGAS